MLSANRNMQFGRLTVLMLGEQVVNIALLIFLAWWLNSVWALAIGLVVSVTSICLLSHVFLKGESNWFALEKDSTRRMFQFGKFIFLSTLAGYFLNQGDKVILGRYVSLEDLAIYNIAYVLAAMPLLLSGMFNERIFYPLYARQPPTESEANRWQLNKTRLFVSAGMVSVIALMALVGDPLVRLLYDSRYHAAGAMMTLIALSLLPRLITFSYERMSLAYGHSGKFAILTIGVAGVQMIFLYFGVRETRAFGRDHRAATRNHCDLSPALVDQLALSRLARAARPDLLDRRLRDCLSGDLVSLGCGCAAFRKPAVLGWSLIFDQPTFLAAQTAPPVFQHTLRFRQFAQCQKKRRGPVLRSVGSAGQSVRHTTEKARRSPKQ